MYIFMFKYISIYVYPYTNHKELFSSLYFYILKKSRTDVASLGVLFMTSKNPALPSSFLHSPFDRVASSPFYQLSSAWFLVCAIPESALVCRAYISFPNQQPIQALCVSASTSCTRLTSSISHSILYFNFSSHSSYRVFILISCMQCAGGLLWP